METRHRTRERERTGTTVHCGVFTRDVPEGRRPNYRRQQCCRKLTRGRIICVVRNDTWTRLTKKKNVFNMIFVVVFLIRYDFLRSLCIRIYR